MWFFPESRHCTLSRKKSAGVLRVFAVTCAIIPAGPLLDALIQWLEETLGKLSRVSDTARAVRYALSRLDALMRFCEGISRL